MPRHTLAPCYAHFGPVIDSTCALQAQNMHHRTLYPHTLAVPLWAAPKHVWAPTDTPWTSKCEVRKKAGKDLMLIPVIICSSCLGAKFRHNTNMGFGATGHVGNSFRCDSVKSVQGRVI
jgi:hypothetical protein